MFVVTKYNIVAQEPKKYLSFPDIIQSKVNYNQFFITYREGNRHHPKWSKLIVLESLDGGDTWEEKHSFSLNLLKHGAVWNCPRLSYINNALSIICDAKNGTIERLSSFNTHRFTSYNNGKDFFHTKTEMPGMVPDKVIQFKNKLICANHKIKSSKNDLVQLVSWSRDDGETWYDTNILANNKREQFCEASIVKLSKNRLIAYLRDNSDHMRKIWRSTSNDGIYWTKPYPLNIYGQRPTAMKDINNVICAIRNTKNCTVSVFSHNIVTDEIENSTIDVEQRINQYHYGYTGMCKIFMNKYFVVYYIKNEEPNPFIKLATIKKI